MCGRMASINRPKSKKASVVSMIREIDAFFDRRRTASRISKFVAGKTGSVMSQKILLHSDAKSMAIRRHSWHANVSVKVVA